MADFRFRPYQHIRSGADFRRAYRRRASAADGVLIVYAHPNGRTHSRLGLSVSRKVGGAVVRNRWKRRIREAFRLSQHELPEGVDFVVIPRAGVEPDFQKIAQSLPRLARRAAERLSPRRRKSGARK